MIGYPRLHERRDTIGKVTRKRYGADFKAKVALDAIKGEQTLAELAAKHGIHQTMIAGCKRQAIEGLATTFSGNAEMVRNPTPRRRSAWGYGVTAFPVLMNGASSVIAEALGPQIGDNARVAIGVCPAV